MAIDVSNFNLYERLRQRKSPAPGATLKVKEVTTEELESQRNRLKPRFVFFPGFDINLQLDAKQAISLPYLFRGRWAKLTLTAYKASDSSLEAFLDESDKELPLREYLMTPFAQAVYLYHNYFELGLRVGELLNPQDMHIRVNEDEFDAIVARVEAVIMPEVPMNLRSTADYLIEKAPSNIANSNLTDDESTIAAYMLDEMLKSCTVAFKYQMSVLDATEAEMVSKVRGSKTNPDDVDNLFYYMCDRVKPRPETLQYQGQENAVEQNNSLVKELVGYLRAGKTDGEETTPAEVSSLRGQVAELSSQVQALMAALGGNIPAVQVDSPAHINLEEIEKSGISEEVKQEILDAVQSPKKPRRTPFVD